VTKFNLVLLLSLLTVSANAEMRPIARAVVPVTDPTMVVDDRGTKLEILPGERAAVGTDSAGRAAVQRVQVTSTETPFSSLQPGLVFNHSYQQYGYIIGEIAFRMKGGRAPGADFPSSLYPRLKKIGTLDMYAVTAPNPRVFLEVLKRLQARTDLDWVVPTVTYFPANSTASVR
jgi:hypothetical protein